MASQNRQGTKLVAWLLTCCSLFMNVFAQEQKNEDKVLRFYNEISPPFFWLDDNNQPQGANYDLAMALMAHTKLKGVIEELPWARAVVEAANKPDIVLLTALRTELREKQLQWLGTVHTAQAHLLAMKKNSNIQIIDFEDAKKYMVGTIRGYGAADFFINKGFVEGENLKLLSSQTQLWSMLFKGRIDLVLDNLTTAQFEINRAGVSIEDVNSLMSIDALKANLEMATGHLTDPATTERLRMGLQHLKNNGEYQRIMEKWGLAE